MEIFGVNVVMTTALAIVVLGFVEWAKTPKMPVWGVRAISLAISYGVLGLIILLQPMTWQMFVVTGFVIFAEANGIWHGVAVTKK
jgi:hypothetical protein